MNLVNRITTYLIFTILMFATSLVKGQIAFNDFFENSTFRYDFYLTGDSEHIFLSPAQMKREGIWSGPVKQCVDTLNYGTFRFRIFDKESGVEIFSQGLNPLFQEWQSTAESKELNRSYYHGVRFPYPRAMFTIAFEERLYSGKFNRVFEQDIDPNDYTIIEETSHRYPVKNILNPVSEQPRVDIAIVAEGYTDSEMEVFISDAERLIEGLFSKEPFKTYRDQFNVYAIESPSIDSGTDIPADNIFMNTAVNSSFSTFGVDRYLTTSDMKSVYDIASVVPWDFVIVLVNTDMYGGGGFYNFYSIATSDNRLSEQVLIHEFGHGFAGLADEYYSSEVAYEDYYNLEVEPWEPNITTDVDFESKWKDMIKTTTETPTAREAGNEDVVGLFEGGGYMAKGIYSPVMDCRMKSNEPEGFCPVCIRAIENTIKKYTEK